MTQRGLVLLALAALGFSASFTPATAQKKYDPGVNWNGIGFTSPIGRDRFAQQIG
jgi:hypothetical protein